MENAEDAPSNSRRFSDLGLKRMSTTKLDEIFKSPGFDFMGKKRKRHLPEEDSVSLHSVDLGNISEDSKKHSKRRRSFSKTLSNSVANVTNIFSPQRGKKGSEDGSGGLLRSFSVKNLMSPSKGKTGNKNEKIHQDTPYKRPGPSTPKRRRESEFWHQTVSGFDAENYDSSQIKRQEAIYELFKGECDMIDDLEMVKKTYHDAMKTLGLMSNEELHLIFGHINDLVPLHRDLVEHLKEQRLTDGTTEFVGQVILDWVPQLVKYIDYCSNQVFAKALLNFKKQDPCVEDFLTRCQDSPFSRRLDLWSFLDVPRSKMVKYPLLFKAIQKCTSEEHTDYDLLTQATEKVQELIQEVDLKAGEAKCEFTKKKLDYLEDKQRSHLIDESQAVLCDGILKNNRGTKLYVFLFEKILVLTRPATRSGMLKYQVYRQPIPVSELTLQDCDSDGKLGGSFRSAFSQGQPVKHMFKVGFVDGNSGQSHTLQANDEHDRKQWTSTIRSVLPPREERRESADGMEDLSFTGSPACSKRPLTRQSSKASIASTVSSASSTFSMESRGVKRTSSSKLPRQSSKTKLPKQDSKTKLRRSSGSFKKRFSLGMKSSKRRDSGSVPATPPTERRQEGDGAN